MLSNNKIEESSSALLKRLWESGVEGVGGRASVKRFFSQHQPENADYSVIAIGKAATDMMLGAIDVFGAQLKSGLVLTKTDHLTDELLQYPHIVSHESAHPVPDENSLQSGKMLLNYIAEIPKEHEVLVLISGGASSLVEVLPEHCCLADLQKISEWGLQNGLNINEINYMRQKISLIKGGKLCQYFNQAKVLCLYISDVPEDNIHVIGSGLLCSDGDISELVSNESKQKIDHFLQQEAKVDSLSAPSAKLQSQFDHYIVANNQIAKHSVQACAQGLALENSVCVMDDSIDMDYRDVANMLMEKLAVASAGIYIWGGEPTVELPDNPGDGGRNQALALLLSIKIKAMPNITILVAGTDGTDGPTNAAGAVVDGYTYGNATDNGFEPEVVLDEANAYPCLKAVGSLFCPGPTGTNVMDLIIVKVD